MKMFARLQAPTPAPARTVDWRMQISKRISFREAELLVLVLGFLSRIGLCDRLGRWREVCGLDAKYTAQTAEERIRRRREVKVN